MRRWEAWLQHIANALAALTGLAWAWLKYFAEAPAADAYSAVGSPWEPRLHDAHVLAVPLLVWACGVIWRGHVAPQWRARRAAGLGAGKKWSGLGLLFALLPMVSTGYLIQVSVEETWRKSFVAAHLVTSAVWVLGYGAHFVAAALTRHDRGSSAAAASRPRTSP